MAELVHTQVYLISNYHRARQGCDYWKGTLWGLMKICSPRVREYYNQTLGHGEDEARNTQRCFVWLVCYFNNEL